MKRTTVVFSALLTVISAGALAENAGLNGAAGYGEGEKHTDVVQFEELNQNQDNVLTQEEYQNSEADSDVAFSDLDKNSDGEVTSEEYFSFFRDDFKEDRISAE